MQLRSTEILESLLTGEELTPEQVDELIRTRTPEDLYLDYKHGNELQEHKKATRTIREYVAGFANAAGGVLLFGVDEDTWSVTGCKPLDGSRFQDWVARCLNPIAAYLLPPPRVHVVQHPQGNVLVIATDRSATLVPCVEKGEPLYYFRFGDQTLPAPEYLMNDLMLGRRQHPYLGLRLRAGRVERNVTAGSTNVIINLSFELENEGISWSQGARLGIIAWAIGNNAYPRIGSYLRGQIDIQELDRETYSGPLDLVHILGGNIGSIEPFQTGLFSHLWPVTLPLRTFPGWYKYNWKAALYLIARDAPPSWFQVTLNVDSELLKLVDSNANLATEENRFHIRRLSGERPIVAWEQLTRR